MQSEGSQKIEAIPFDFSDNHYDTLVSFLNQTWPHEPSSALECKVEDKNHPDKALHRYFYTRAGEVVAFGELQQTTWTEDEHSYSLEIIVDRGHRRHGYGSQVYSHLMGLPLNYSMQSLEAGTTSVETDGPRFLEQRGFVHATTEFVSALRLRDWNVAHFQEYLDKIDKKGVRLLRYDELEQNGFSQEDLFEVWRSVDADVPWHAEHVPETFEQWKRRQAAGAVKVLFAHSFVAVHEEQIVGLSALTVRRGVEDSYHTGLTGVLASHRRQGITMALKVASLQSVVDETSTIEKIWTENEEDNPMYTINQKLGFKREYDLLFYQKKCLNPSIS